MKLVLRLITAALLLMAMGLPAEARRRIPLFIPIPSSETVVKVKDLPDTGALRHKSGAYIDLGYRFTTTGGDWVGYIGSSSQYIALPPEKLKALLAVAGEKGLPPVPSRHASSSAASGLKILLIAIGVCAILLRVALWGMALMRGAARATNLASLAFTQTAKRQRFEDDEEGAISEKMEARIAQAAAAFAAGNTQSQSDFGRASEPVTFGRRS